MKTFLVFFTTLLGLVAFGGALACGPSFQAIYEGNVRFEHCYALEENAQTTLRDKSDCWRDWSEHYTFGQTRDRIHYATARYVALSQVIPTDEAMMMAAPGMAPRRSTITAPAPTNAFAPPPKVLEDAGSPRPLRPSEVPVVVTLPAPTPPDAGPAAPSLPASDCGGTCGTVFQVCQDGCAIIIDAGPRTPKDAACKACEKTYRACMRGCFK